MKSDKTNLLAAELLDDHAEMSLEQLCITYKLSREEVVNMVDEGIIDPLGHKPAVWRFQAISLRRIRITRTLQQDLGVNMQGAALALDLLEELEELRARIRHLKG